MHIKSVYLEYIYICIIFACMCIFFSAELIAASTKDIADPVATEDPYGYGSGLAEHTLAKREETPED